MNGKVWKKNGTFLLVAGATYAVITMLAGDNHWVAITVPEAIDGMIGVGVTLTGFVMWTIGQSLLEK